MNLAVVVAVFPVIALGELPDKTMFASLVMSTRGRPRAIWLGAACAFTVHVVIAVTVGVALFHLLPRRTVDSVVAGLFLAGAVLAVREATRERQVDQRRAELGDRSVGHRRSFATAFVVIFLAEWGDLTQILIADFAARYHSPFSVGVGALLALWVVAALAVAGGRGLLRFSNLALLRVLTGVVLLGLAGYAAWSAAHA